MRRYPRFSFLLVALAIFISLNVAYLYQAYYEDIDLMVRKHFSEQDQENLLTFIQKNPRIFYCPGPSIQQDMIFLTQVPFFQPSFLLPQDSQTLVLRC